MNSLFEPLTAQLIIDEPLYHPSSVWKRFFYDTRALAGLFLMGLLLSLALFGPFLSGYTYDEINLEAKNLSPGFQYWFGTDDLGRDLFTRTWYGARISLSIGILAALIDVTLGVFWGSLAGYAGGKIEEGLMSIANILFSLPYLLVVIVLSVVLGSGFFSILVALTLLGWVSMARVICGYVRQMMQQYYIQSSIIMGAGFIHILKKHLIPNLLGPIVVTLATTVPSAIFAEAFLSFLGLGIQAPMSSWGSMAQDGLNALSYYPWRLFFPAAAISLTMLACHLMGDALAHAFDLRESTL